MFKVLIMGLPGSGKTTLATKLNAELQKLNETSLHLNADFLRQLHDDWDFSYEGRIRQADRISRISEQSKEDYIIMDFVCPLPDTRTIVNADYIIYMDTIQSSRFDDTNKIFIPPQTINLHIKDRGYSVHDIAQDIINSL